MFSIRVNNRVALTASPARITENPDLQVKNLEYRSGWS